MSYISKILVLALSSFSSLSPSPSPALSQRHPRSLKWFAETKEQDRYHHYNHFMIYIQTPIIIIITIFIYRTPTYDRHSSDHTNLFCRSRPTRSLSSLSFSFSLPLSLSFHERHIITTLVMIPISFADPDLTITVDLEREEQERNGRRK